MIPWETSSAYLRKAFSLGFRERTTQLCDSVAGQAHLFSAVWFQVTELVDKREKAYEKTMSTPMTEEARVAIYSQHFEYCHGDGPFAQSMIAFITAEAEFEAGLGDLLSDEPWFESAAFLVAKSLGISDQPPDEESLLDLFLSLGTDNHLESLRLKAHSLEDDMEREEWLAKPGLSQRKLDIVRLLLSLQPAERRSVRAIADYLISIKHEAIHEGVVEKDLKELKPYGIANQMRVGYFVRPDAKKFLSMIACGDSPLS
jgi:hypothetical protein